MSAVPIEATWPSGAIFTFLGGAHAGAALSQKLGLPEEPLQAIFVHAYHVTLLSCMFVASIGVFTSLLRGQKLGRGKREE